MTASLSIENLRKVGDGLWHGYGSNMYKRMEDSSLAGVVNRILTTVSQIGAISCAIGLTNKALEAASCKAAISFPWKCVLFLTPIISNITCSKFNLKENPNIKRTAIFINSHIGSVCQIASLVSSIALIIFGHTIIGSVSLSFIIAGYFQRRCWMPTYLNFGINAFGSIGINVVRLLVESPFYKFIAICEIANFIFIQYNKYKIYFEKPLSDLLSSKINITDIPPFSSLEISNEHYKDQIKNIPTPEIEIKILNDMLNNMIEVFDLKNPDNFKTLKDIVDKNIETLNNIVKKNLETLNKKEFNLKNPEDLEKLLDILKNNIDKLNNKEKNSDNLETSKDIAKKNLESRNEKELDLKNPDNVKTLIDSAQKNLETLNQKEFDLKNLDNLKMLKDIVQKNIDYAKMIKTREDFVEKNISPLKQIVIKDEHWLEFNSNQQSNDQILNYVTKGLNNLINNLNNQIITTGDIVDYKPLIKYSKHIAADLRTTKKEDKLDNLVKLSLASYYCPAGLQEKVSSVYYAVCNRVEEASLKFKLYQALELSRTMIFDQFISFSYNIYPSIMQRAMDITDNHNHNELINLYGRYFHLTNAQKAAQEDSLAIVDIITQKIMEVLFGRTMKDYFNHKYTKEHIIQTLSEAIKDSRLPYALVEKWFIDEYADFLKSTKPKLSSQEESDYNKELRNKATNWVQKNLFTDEMQTNFNEELLGYFLIRHGVLKPK